MALLIASCFVLLSISPAMAIDWSSELRTYISADATSNGGTSVVSTSTIIPGKDFIIGYSVCPTSTGSEEVVGLYDSTEANMTTTTIFAETEAEDNESLTVWFPYPKKITTSLAIGQGKDTIVAVYYIRRSP